MSDVIEQGTKAPAAAPVADRVVPYAVLAELTHRCPLQCPYCSNPLELERSSNELQTEDWLRVIDQSVACRKDGTVQQSDYFCRALNP